MTLQIPCKNTNDEELLHTFVYSRMPRPIAHRFNDGYLLELKIILLMLAKGEYKITSSPKI
ncbi:unknown [Bacteroides sp. CAG:661]|nr:unknown [Bacteroides sp. CAG:661]